MIQTWRRIGKFRRGSFPLYDRLGDLYDGHTAEGNYNFISSEPSHQDGLSQVPSITQVEDETEEERVGEVDADELQILEEEDIAAARVAPKDKIFERVINPYLTEVLQHPQSIKMSEGMLHIRDVEGPKKTGSVETRLEAMEQQVFKCQGMVERRLNTNHRMITEFTNNHKMDAIDIGKHLSRLYDRIDQLQGQIYDLQNKNCEYEYRFK
ncbi:40S ribosomal protein S5-1 [Hordeum vulgare]|nr:40S ribosomal protein S5-1 [Hordeum vulgare]